MSLLYILLCDLGKNDSPSVGLGFFLCQRSGLGRFLPRDDTLQIILQREVARNIPLHCPLPNPPLTMNSRSEDHHTPGFNSSLCLGRSHHTSKQAGHIDRWILSSN